MYCTHCVDVGAFDVILFYFFLFCRFIIESNECEHATHGLGQWETFHFRNKLRVLSHKCNRQYHFIVIIIRYNGINTFLAVRWCNSKWKTHLALLFGGECPCLCTVCNCAIFTSPNGSWQNYVSNNFGSRTKMLRLCSRTNRFELFCFITSTTWFFDGNNFILFSVV